MSFTSDYYKAKKKWKVNEELVSSGNSFSDEYAAAKAQLATDDHPVFQYVSDGGKADAFREGWLAVQQARKEQEEGKRQAVVNGVLKVADTMANIASAPYRMRLGIANSAVTGFDRFHKKLDESYLERRKEREKAGTLDLYDYYYDANKRLKELLEERQALYESPDGNVLSLNDDIYRAILEVEKYKGMLKRRRKEEEEEEDDGLLDLFDSGVFSDGYQFGDATKAILGTGADAGVSVVKGLGKLGEGVIDFGGYGVAQVADWFGADDAADSIRDVMQENSVDDLFDDAVTTLDKYSLLGNTTLSVGEGLGQVAGIVATGGLGSAAGLGAAGTSALTLGVTGASSMGSGIGEAYQGGATDGEAWAYGSIAGASDVITEALFGGLGKGINALGVSKGLSSADDMLAKKVSGLFKKQITKNLAEYGIKAGAEGFEEVLAGIAQAAGKKATYMSEEEFGEILADENLLEQFVVGAVTSGIAQSGGLISSVKNETDFVTGLNENEQSVVDKVYESEVAESETDGQKLSGKEKNKLFDSIVERMNKGYISVDTIEEALGGDEYTAYKETVDNEDAQIKEIENQLKELEEAPNTVGNSKKYDSLQSQLEELKSNSQRDQLKQTLSDKVFSLVKDSRLAESYNERARRGQAFEADLSKYDEKQKAVIQKAVESGFLNNTNRTHEFVDLVAKISADKGVLFDFTNNEKLKKSGFAVDGKTVNGYVTKDGVTINMDSAKYVNSVVGHEITHVLEGTELYTELQSAVMSFAKSKGDYQGRYDALVELYKDIADADINAELTADLVGDYLFTDSDFINKLSTENRNVFQKIYDEIKYLLKVATAGSKEARELEKVKKAFDKAYQIKSVANKKPTADADIRYSLTEYTDAEKKAHNEAVKNHFGKTYSWNETGYLLLDGTKLDLSGKHEGASGGYRTVDHRDIVAALGDDYGNGDYSGALVQFMSEGNIRIIPEMGGINLSVKPTEAQEKALAEYVAKYRGEVVVDIDDANGYTVVSIEYPIGTRAGKVLSDIRGWFENGTKPETATTYSLTKQGETPKTYGNYNVSGKDLSLEQEVAPVVEQKATDNVTTENKVTTDTALDDYAPITEQEADALREESFASLDDADMPPEVETHSDSFADAISLDNKALKQLSKNISDSLGLNRAGKKELERVLQDFSKDEYGTRESLYAEIERRFGTQYEEMRNDEVAAAKEYIRNTKITVSPTVKSEFGEAKDYFNFMRSNFGKIKFSKDGLGVDEVYAELTELYPALFDDDAINAADQMRRIADVANTPVSELIPTRLPQDVLQDATDMIYDSIGEYKETERMIATADMQNVANAHIEDFAPIGDGVETVSQVETVSPAESAVQEEAKQPTAEKKSKRQELHDGIIEGIKSRFKEKGFDFDKVLSKAKDLSTLATVDNTPQRVMEKALGYKEGQVLSDITVNQVAQNETEGIKWLNSFTDRKSGVLAQISKQYGIKAGGKESAAAQMYAEGFYVAENGNIVKYGDAELSADFPDANVRFNIKSLASDPRIRQIYDDTLAMINESRSRNAYPEIPRLDNYFLHFRAMEDTFSRLGLPFNPNDIRAKDLPTDLNGVTADLKPGQPYFASAMHRTGKRTSFDLLGGLERYLTSAKNQIYHIDDIQTLRALRNYIADTYGQAKGLEGLDTLSEEEVQDRIEKVYGAHLSTFAKFLNEEANVLAGKTALIDRGIEGIIGRRGITFIDTLNRQVGSNMVGLNPSSSLTNFISVAQTFAKTNKFDFVKAFAQIVSNKIGSIVGKTDGFAENSPVIIRRKGAERFYRTPFQKAADAGYVLMSAVDNISTELIARTKYNELTRKGMDSQQAHFETDKWVSRLMGDRSLGQQPQLYNSKMLGLITKFQLEVRNQLDSQFYDTVQEAKVSNEDIQNGLARNAKTAAKVASTFVQLAIVQHLFGKAFESVAGYNPAFDIISVLATAFGFDDDDESEDTVLDNIEQGFIELLGDLPYTSTLTGGRIPISSALPIEELVTGVDQYGNEKSRWETLGEIAPYYVLPTGYGQIKKTRQGLGMFDDDLPIAGSYTDSGNLRFPIDDTLGNRIQAGLFGQWASKNAREYFDNDWAPLKEKQIDEFIDLDIPIKEYREIREDLSELDKLEEKAEYIGGLDLTTEQKNILINNIANRKDPINMEDYDEYDSFDEFDFAEKNPEKYKFFKDNGISYSDYASADEDTKRAYNWAFENPEKYIVSQAICDDFKTYYRYKSELSDIRADKDENGETISGSAKEKKIEYINNLDLDYGQKIILLRSMYDSKEDRANYNADIVDYLNDREDISYEEMVTILKELGFTVHSNGTVEW